MAELTIQQALEIANRQFQSGQVEDAESLYRQILGYQPNHTPTIQMLAQLCQQLGRAKESEELMRRSLAVDPRDPAAHNNLAMVLASQGRFDESIQSFGRALMLRPAFPEAYNNLGNTLRASGKLPEAIRAYQKAVQLLPTYGDARDNLNDALREQANRERMQAAQAESQVMIEVPDEVLTGEHGQAVESPQAQPTGLEDEAAHVPQEEQLASVPAGPEHEPKAPEPDVEPEPMEQRHNAEEPPLLAEPESPMPPELIEEFAAAPAAAPMGPDREVDTFEFAERGELQLESPEREADELEPVPLQSEMPPAAAEAAPAEVRIEEEPEPDETEAIELKEPEAPVEPEPIPVEASPAQEAEEPAEIDRPEEITAATEKPEEIELPPIPTWEDMAEPEEVPQSADDFIQRGRSRWADGRLDEAAADFHAALDLEPSDAEARTDLGLVLLTQGDFQHGWPAYEAKLAGSSPLSALSQPLWDGADLANHRILLRAEQSVTDAIQFIRYAPLVAKRGGRVIVRCLPELRRLLVDQPGILLLLSTADPMPKFYTHCPIASLPRVMGTTPDTIPADVPYLLPDGKLVDKWYARISSERAGLKVGLALRTEPTLAPEGDTVSPAADLAALDEVSGAHFYALQTPQRDGNTELPPGLNVVDWTAELRDLAETAALISCLDVVITTDNVIAHLAGALGRPTWLLIPPVADWRWMTGRTDSPWYPTATLYRQANPHEWGEPVQQLIRDLREKSQEQQ